MGIAEDIKADRAWRERALRHHDALVAALEGAIAQMETDLDELPEALTKARAVLAAVRADGG